MDADDGGGGGVKRRAARPASLPPRTSWRCAAGLVPGQSEAVESSVLIQDDEARAGVLGVDALHGAKEEGVVDLRERATLPGALSESVLLRVQRHAISLQEVRHHHIAQAEVVESLQVGLDPRHHILDEHE